MQEKSINNEDNRPKGETPDEKTGILTQGKIKIFDPISKEVFVEQRA
jgi:hypothetical protein